MSVASLDVEKATAGLINTIRARSFAPRKYLSVSQWADAYRILSSKASAESGQWRTSRNPIQREIMDCFSARSPIQQVVLMLPIQIGKSEMLLNIMAYSMIESPSPIMACFPAEVSLQKFSNQKINPLFAECPAVKDVLSTDSGRRESSSTKFFKDFIGGQLYLEHAGSPSRLKSTSVKILLVDELDTFAENLNGVDDPIDLLLGRTTAYPSTHKILFASTPQIKGLSRTDQLYERSDQRRYHVACVYCGHEQPLEWKNLHWSKLNGTIINVLYHCCECGVGIEEHYKTEMIRNGRWVPTHPGRKLRGYHLNCLYYPIGLGVRWLDLAEAWLDCQNDIPRLKTFINDRLAEAFEDPLMRQIKLNVIADRAESYPLRIAPLGVGALTAGVDTQDNRLAVQIVGWGVGMSAWVLDYVEILGDPNEDEVWNQLTELLNTPIEGANGKKLTILATAIDGGGHRTEAVKDYVRKRLIKRPLVIFGATNPTAPVLSKPKPADVNYRGQLAKFGVHIQHVGTVAIKHRLFAAITADSDKEPEQRSLHFSDELSREYFVGLTSETFDPKKNNFVCKKGARNESLDTLVYAYAAAYHHELRLHLYAKAKWQGLASSSKEPNHEIKPIAVKKSFFIPE